MPPRSKNGSKISSLVSAEDPRRRRQRRAGPATDQLPEQHQQRENDQRRHDTHRGLLAILMYFSARGACFGVIVTTGAAVVGEVTGIAVAVASVFIACIDIEIVSPRFDGAGRCMLRAARFGSDLNTLDRQRLQIRSRIPGIEHLAVEEGLLAARGRGRNIGSGNAQLLGGVLPEIFAVHLARSAPCCRSPRSYLPQRMSSVMNQRSWLWNG